METNRPLVIINEGTLSYAGDIDLGADIIINNCVTGTLNGANMAISNEGIINNLGTVNLTGYLRNNHIGGYIYNGGTFNIDGNFRNNGVICGPDVGCGVFSVGGSSSNPTGSFGADAGGVDCGNVDICDVGNDGINFFLWFWALLILSSSREIVSQIVCHERRGSVSEFWL